MCSLCSSNSKQSRELHEFLARAEIDESGALKFPSIGTLGTVFGLAGPVIGGIIDHFKNNGSQQQRRDALAFDELLARAEVDESGAFKLPSLESAAGVAGILSSAVNIVHNLFGYAGRTLLKHSR